jgi:hypothetical protein
MKKLIVTGGRLYKNKSLVYKTLDFINPDIIINGGATGADSLCRDWASDRKKVIVTYEADWNKYGPSAGPRRNYLMCKENINASLVAFSGNSGTMNCVTNAKKFKILVIKIEE